MNHLSDDTFELFLSQISDKDEIDMRDLTFVDPFGMVGILEAGRRFVRQWNGNISIRSGTARFSIIPDWAWGREKETNLVYFSGAQISIMLPEL